MSGRQINGRLDLRRLGHVAADKTHRGAVLLLEGAARFLLHVGGDHLGALLHEQLQRA